MLNLYFDFYTEHQTYEIIYRIVHFIFFWRGKLPEGDSYPEARANEYAVGEDIIKQSETIDNNGDGRSSRNSKYRSECWDEEQAPPFEGRHLRFRRGSYGEYIQRSYGRGRQGRGRHGGPCLWETSYYMGDNWLIKKHFSPV